MKKSFKFIITFFLISCLSLFNFCISSEQNFLSVDEAFKPTLTQNDNEVIITFDIAPNYYLYQEKFKHEPIRSSIAKFEIPNGISHNDEYMGLSHIYYNSVNLKFYLTKTEPFSQIKLTYQGCTEGMCYPPTEKIFSLERITTPYTEKETTQKVENENITNSSENSFISFSSIQTSDSNAIYQKIKNSGFVIGLILFFLFGVLLSMTPCVFPMYPIWSSIILGNHQRTIKTNLIYSFAYIQGIAISYMIAGLCIASLGAKFHTFIQQPIVLGLLSIFFIILALSMFGLFNLTLPTKFVNKLEILSSKQKAGSFIGVFLMGVISAIIASPCTTAPLAGALLFIIQDGNILKGASNLYVLGLGMGTPLIIIGILGQKFLPKNGNWMYLIKILCGLLMLTVPLFLLQSLIPTMILYSLWIILSLIGLLYILWYFKILNKKYFIIFSTLSLILTFSYIFINYENFCYKDNFIEVKTLSELDKVLQNKEYVILDFRADWCTSCKQLEKETFTNSEVIESFKKYTLLFTDTTNTDSPGLSIAQKYNVQGVPVILVFKNGEIVKQFNGFQEPKNFAETINKIQ